MSLTPTPLYCLDRASGTLDAQLPSAQVGGTFTFTPTASTPLGSQSYNMPGGQNCVVTIENEQILISAMSIAAGDVTCTISQRGYNGTSAATHVISTAVNFNVNKNHPDNLQTQIAATQTIVNLDDASILSCLAYQSTVTTIVSATSHTIAGDQTAIFKVGRHYWFEVVTTWYRATIVTVSLGGGTTTITVMGNSLAAAGVVVACGFEFTPSLRGNEDVQLVNDLAIDPVVHPPTGGNWFYFIGGSLRSMSSAGTISTYTTGDPVGSLIAGENITAGQALYVKASDGKAWRAVASGDESTFSFIGIASVTVLATATVTFWKAGAVATVVVSAGALTTGQYLFLTDTLATIDVTPGTRFAKVAQAMSTTSVRVIEPKFMRSGTQSVSATTTYVQTTGFYPSRIICWTAQNSGASQGVSDNACLAFRATDSTASYVGVVAESNAYSNSTYNSAHVNVGTISAKSETGFTISNINDGVHGACPVNWTAYSD
jgi:hypothetical protein